MSDVYGIPDNFFGYVPEPFYARVGRVVVLAALLDQQLLYLLWTLDRVSTQDVHAGRFGSDLIKQSRAELAAYPYDLRNRTGELLDSIADLQHRRNEIVHNVWPDHREDKSYGHRTVKRGQRPDPQTWIKDGFVSAEDMERLIHDLVAAVESLTHLRGLVEAEAQRLR